MVRGQHAVGAGVTRAVLVLQTGGRLLGHQQRHAAQRWQVALAGRGVPGVARVAGVVGGVGVDRVAAEVAHHLSAVLHAQRGLQAVRQVERGLLSSVEPASVRHCAQGVVAAS